MNLKFQKLIKEKGSKLNLQIDLSNVIKYLTERERDEGGFSFSPNLYPNIEDTYYAIRTFQLLGVEINRSKTANYLQCIDWNYVGYPRAIYMILYLHLSTGIQLPKPLLDFLKKDWSRFHLLDAQYFSNEIQKLLNQHFKLLSSSFDFQFHPQDSLQSLRKKVSILTDFNISFDKNEVIRWVQLCQNGDGGFGFYPGTTSFMENTYCAIEILSKLQALPRRIETCREYILGCQTKSGGFGRAPNSFPFIETTFQAVLGLFLLEKMEMGNE
jgi:hypothetical protein